MFSIKLFVFVFIMKRVIQIKHKNNYALLSTLLCYKKS